jgi:hypothetical protein
LRERVKLFEEMIGSRKSTFIAAKISSLPATLSGTHNLPLNFLSVFDEAGFRPKVVLKTSPAMPVDELTIYRFTSTYSGKHT